MRSLPRVTVSAVLRAVVCAFLSAHLICSPLFALPVARAEVPQLPLSAGNVPAITLEHRAGEVLVKFRADAQAEARAQIIKQVAQKERRLRGGSGISVLTLKAEADLAVTLSMLEQLAGVIEWAEPNYLVTRAADEAPRTWHRAPNDPRFPEQWALRNSGRHHGVPGADIGARAAWRVTTGSRETVIAVIDTGIDLKHPDLKPNLWRNAEEAKGVSSADDDRNGYADDLIGWNFVGDNNDVTDDSGHGTMVAGIIAAKGQNAKGITGVMPQAGLLPLKALDATGTGTVAQVVEAMDYALAKHAAVINCSFGTPANSHALQEAVERAGAASIIVVAAAGNNSQDLAQSPYYPASYQAANLIAVAATTNGDQLADFSNWGSKVTIAAPGMGILTTQRGGKYAQLSGTSAAASLVTGVAGLLKSVRNWVSPHMLRQSLLAGARRVPELAGKVESESVVNAGGALVAMTRPSAESGYAWLNAVASTPVAPMVQGTANLDYMRANNPSAPDAYSQSGSLPGSGYDDPQPVTTSNFSSYYTDLTKAENATGPAGSQPYQAADPTAGASVVGGLSINLTSNGTPYPSLNPAPVKNINFTAPVLALKGRAGLDLNLALVHNSKVWMRAVSPDKMVFNADKGFPGPGWRIGFGAIQGINQSGNIGPYANSITGKDSFLYLAPDGSRHDLAYNSTTNLYESYDSSYLDFNATSKVLRTPAGTQVTFGTQATANGDYQFLPTLIKDRQGNMINISYRTLSNNDVVIDYIIDTLGRRIDFTYSNNRLIDVRQDRNGTTYKFVILDYTPVTINTNFTSTLDQSNINGTQVYLPSRITYPTGQNLRLYYTSYAQMYLIEKWVPGISGQGTARRLGYTQFNLPSYNGASYPSNSLVTSLNSSFLDGPDFSSRSEQGENWWGGVAATYYYSSQVSVSSSPSTNPDGTYVTHVVEDPTSRNYQCTFYPLSQRLKVVMPGKTIEETYIQETGVSYTSNQRLSTSKTTDETSQSKRTSLTYVQRDGMWLVATKDDIDQYQTVYRRAAVTYTSYPTQHILGLPVEETIYAGAGATLLAKTVKAYDETGSYTDSNNASAPYWIDESGAGVVQHDNSNYSGSFTSRGNLTSVTQYSVTSGTASSPRIISRISYDTNGNVRATADGAGNRAQVLFTDNFSNKPAGIGATQAYPYTTQNPIGFRVGAQYNYYTGQLLKSFNLRPNSSTEEQVVTTSYDFADRPLQTNQPNGGSVRTAYWDNWLNVSTFQQIASGVVRFKFEEYDGAGRTWRKGNDHPSAATGKYAGQKVYFNEVGQAADTSTVIAMTGDWAPADEDAAPTGLGWIYNDHTYDEQNRLIYLTHPDDSTLAFEYAGCGCVGGATARYSERGSKTETTKDWLGRLAKADEYNVQADTIYGTASYSYDQLDRLLQINHNGQLRSFVYDGYGRLQSETTPEGGTVTYTYTANDQVATVSNQRSMTKQMSYNTRNLVTQVSYNDSGATPTASFQYDDYGARTQMTDGEGVTTYSYNSYRQLESETRSFTGLSGKTYTLSYSYNQAGEVLQVSYIAANSSGATQPPQPSEPRRTVTETRAKTVTSSREVHLNVGRPGEDESRGPEAARNFVITGWVKTPSGQGVGSVTITLDWTRESGTGHDTTQTDSTGYWQYATELDGQYVVHASKSGYTVTPSQDSFTLDENFTREVNFTATAQVQISGTITNGSGQAMSGVAVTVRGTENRTTTTNSSGQYSFSGLAGGGSSYLVTPSKAGSNFAPLESNLTNVWSNQTANFTGSLVPVQTTFNKKVNYSYNQTGGLTGIGTDWIGSDATSTTNVVNSIVYRGFGKVKSLNYGNGRKLAQTYSDQRHWLKSQVVTKNDGSDAIINQSYTYYNDGLLAQMTDTVETTASCGYNYDDFNRLAQVMASNGTTAIGGYSYDKWGNQTAVSSNAGSYSLSYAKDASNVPLTNRIQSVTPSGGSAINDSYDAAGNMTQEGTTTYSYDAANRLKEVGTGGFNTYGYDGDGKRVRKVEGGGTPLFYVWSSVLGQVMLEVNSDNVQRAYVYGGSILVALLSYDGEFYWSHQDKLGSGKRLTDSTGAVRYRGEFDPFGQTISEWSSPAAVSKSTRKFTGYERDATGLDNANARMYHPNRGRFMQPDGDGLAAVDTSKPQSFNRYSYVQNDPINNVDPDGKLIAKPECKNIGSISVGDFFLGNNCSILPPHLPIPGPPENTPEINVRPFLRIKKTQDGQSEMGGCGASSSKVAWDILGTGREDVDGWVIQHITITVEKFDAQGNRLVSENKPNEYWEAWEVRGGVAYVPGTNIRAEDTFRSAYEGGGSRGTVVRKGLAKLIIGNSIDPSAWPNDAGPDAGSLYSTKNQPKGWTDTGALEHRLTTNWNCLDPNHHTQTVTTIPK